ncbi:glycosyltransferase family 2 protein [Aerococcus viridans]|uniref:glycosyltransferase family 2 protein n=1 Tax=Aerococcus viridans TaxID=1377 RepID=UPI003B2283D4
MLFSVIMPVYNVYNYLENAVLSIISQNNSDWELILIDDGSTDGSESLCDNFANEDSRIISVHQENQGSGAARQKGIDMAKGDYLVFVDPDDYISEDALSNYSLVIKKYRIDVLVNGFYTILKNKNTQGIIRKTVPQISGYFDKNEFIKVYPKYSKKVHKALWNKVYKRSFIVNNDIRFSGSPIGEDWEFNINVYKYLTNIFISKEAYYFYDTRREGSAVRKYRTDRMKLEVKLAEKHKNLFNLWNIYDENKKTYYLDLYGGIVVEINNLMLSNKYSSLRDKATILRSNINSFSDKDMFLYLNSSDFDSFKEKLQFQLLKYKLYYLIFLFLKINKVKKKI